MKQLALASGTIRTLRRIELVQGGLRPISEVCSYTCLFCAGTFG